MEITILGSSSSGNCYKIDDGSGSALLIECGLPIMKIKQLLSFKVSGEIDGCLISHSHLDHCKAVQDLLDMGIKCYISPKEARELYDRGIIKRGKNNNNIVIIESNKQFKAGSYVIKPFEVTHTTPEPLGFYVMSRYSGDRLLYICDTMYSKYTFPSLNYIMVESNYDEEILEGKSNIPNAVREHIKSGHFGLQNTKDFLSALDLSQVRRIYLLHLSDSNSDEVKFKKEIEELTGKPVTIANK